MKKIAVFGDPRMSLEALERFDRDATETVYAAQRQDDADWVSGRGFDSRIVDFRDDNALHELGIGQDIEYLFCFFSADSDNVFLTISARALDRNLRIIATVESPDSAEKLRAAGADRIIDPYEISGCKTYELLIKPEITQILDQSVHKRHALHFAEIEVPTGAWLEKRKMNELRLDERHNLILLGLVDREDGNRLHFAVGDREHMIKAGDVLVLMGPAREIKTFRHELDTQRTN